GAVDGQLLDDVDVLAAAVVALAGVAFGVLVGEHRALRLEHPRAGVVLRGDQLDVLLLAAALAGDRTCELGIETLDGHGGAEHARRPWITLAAGGANCTGVPGKSRVLSGRGYSLKRGGRDFRGWV